MSQKIDRRLAPRPPHTDERRRAIAAGVSNHHRSQLTLAAAFDLLTDVLSDVLVGPRAERIAARMIRRIRRSRKPLTKNLLVGASTGFEVPHPARVFDALVLRGDIVIDESGHCVLPEGSR